MIFCKNSYDYICNMLALSDKKSFSFCGFTELLIETREVQDLLKAARNLDNQKMDGGGYALAPIYNYSRCMLEEKAGYWGTGLPALLLQDVDNGVVAAEVAARQLGVTTTMIHSAIKEWGKKTKKLKAKEHKLSGPVTVQCPEVQRVWLWWRGRFLERAHHRGSAEEGA